MVLELAIPKEELVKVWISMLAIVVCVMCGA